MNKQEWMRSIFSIDCIAINNSDWLVVCDFGRSMTTGTAWEVGYAFGIGKKILDIYMLDDHNDYSVMISGCSTNYVAYSDILSMSDDEIIKLFTERGKLNNETINYN